MPTRIIIFLFLIFSFNCFAQTGSVNGLVSIGDESAEFAQVYIEDSNFGTSTEIDGSFNLSNIPFGNYKVSASYVGAQTISKEISIESSTPLQLNFELKELMLLDEVVITGTKTFKRQTNSPIIVNVLNSQALDDVQACNLSEGLKFQPGLRVETDCQTCNYTQLRMNGLAGGYSQILINGRPIFSPLTGLYGMEQLPVNMIDKIEVVRGGGSSLYG